MAYSQAFENIGVAHHARLVIKYRVRIEKELIEIKIQRHLSNREWLMPKISDQILTGSLRKCCS